MFTLNKEQTKAFEIMASGKNVFLTGNAGTGKSFLIKTFIGFCQNLGKSIMVTAPTGVAALNINGSTIHRAFKVPLDPIGPMTRISKITEAVKRLILSLLMRFLWYVLTYSAISSEPLTKPAK